MNPHTGDIQFFEKEEDVPPGLIKLPHLPYKNCKRCFGRGHVGKMDGKFKLCPKCYSGKNNDLWEQKKAIVAEQLAELKENLKGESS